MLVVACVKLKVKVSTEKLSNLQQMDMKTKHIQYISPW